MLNRDAVPGTFKEKKKKFDIVKKNNSDSRRLRLYIKRRKCSIKVCERKTYMLKIDYCNYKIFLLKPFVLVVAVNICVSTFSE